jgi:hypothetical protein
MFRTRYQIKKWLSGILVSVAVLSLIGASCQTAVGAETSQATIDTPVTTSTTPTVVPTETWPMEITGQIATDPGHAVIGDQVIVTGTGYHANASFDLMWQDIVGSWDVSGGEYYGRQFTENWIKLGDIHTDAQGSFSADFTVPEGFGFNHDLVVLDNGVIRNKMAFFVDMAVSLTQDSGPLGGPIGIVIKGMGWRDYENSWHLHYDNQNTGIITTVTTHGSGIAYIPATGAVGKHIIRVIEGAFTVGYLNHEECPFPDTPTFNLEYTITPGDPVMSPAYESQLLAIIPGTAPQTSAPAVWTDPEAAPVGTPMNINGINLPAGARVDLYWYGVSGNRVSGGGWEQVQNTIGTATVGADGSFTFAYTVPDTHGAGHILEADINGQKVAETTFTIQPSIISLEPTSGPVGTVMHFIVKGVSWTATANNYYVTYDNSAIGYACGFNSNGTINVYLPATGTPGWHYIDFYPGIYKGKEDGKIEQFRIPMLLPEDHPGEDIPVLHFAFYVEG